MFTGIVEEVGIIKSINRNSNKFRMCIIANIILDGIKLGDSICTNGVCLTVTKINSDNIEVDVMPETLRRSNFEKLACGSKVNLERAMSLNSRFGGHIVSGHIDGLGVIKKLFTEGNAKIINIDTDRKVLRYIVEKGSITIDGVSLTVMYVDEYGFEVSIIPHTYNETCLGTKKIGDTVNLECDLIGKYVEKLLSFKFDNESAQNRHITEDFLKDNGFF